MLNLPVLFRKSVYAPEFYRDLPSQPLSFSFKYFYTLAGTLALAFALLVTVFVAPIIYGVLKSAGPELARNFPAESRVELRSGEVAVTGGEPLVIPMPESLRRRFPFKYAPGNLLVVDTRADFTVQKFRDYDTVSWLMKKQVAVADKENDIRLEDVSGAPDIVLDKAVLANFANKAEWMAKAGLPLLVLGIFLVAGLAMLAGLSTVLLDVLLVALALWLVGKLRSDGVAYKEALKISLHASSLAVVLAAVGWLTGGHLSSWISTLITVLIIWINLRPRTPVAESV